MYFTRSLIALAVLSLVGCGDSNNDDGVPELNQMHLSLQPLKKSANNSFTEHYKNGLYLSALGSDNDLRIFETASVDDTSNEFAASATDGNFSSTITQENGVDEADRIKYDGDTLFIANNGRSNIIFATREDTDTTTLAPSTEQTSAHVRILNRQVDNTMLEVGLINIGDQNTEHSTSISGIFLADNKLSVLSNSYSYYAYASFDIWHPPAQTFDFSLYDVSSTNTPNITVDYKIDGHMISSRRVDNTMILISSYTPRIDGLVYSPETEEEKENNYDLIQNVDVDSLLPKYTNTAGVSKPLVTAEQCYIPEDATEKDGFDAIVTITTINLDAPEQVSSVCINASMHGIYATPNSIYVYGTDYGNNVDLPSPSSQPEAESVIHKFSLTGLAVDYQASGKLPGTFGWNQANLRFSEKDQYLRVVSTIRNNNDSDDRFDHRLNIFTTNLAEKTLELVNQLPNELHPEPLGKANEDIYAVRYFNDKAYVVTFLNRDPLYVINLADNANPFIEGELDMIGYSSYLHPISDNLVLGIGQNIDPDRFINTPTVLLEDNESGEDVSKTDELTDSETNNTNVNDTIIADKIVEGVKIALFDVSGEPRLLQEFVFENGSTPAEYNYHALTYLKATSNKHLFTLPVESWSSSSVEGEKYDTWTLNTSLKLFEVNEMANSGELTHTGAIIPEGAQAENSGTWNDRAVIHNDLIYYIHGPEVWQSLWSNPSIVNGPY